MLWASRALGPGSGGGFRDLGGHAPGHLAHKVRALTWRRAQAYAVSGCVFPNLSKL